MITIREGYWLKNLNVEEGRVSFASAEGDPSGVDSLRAQG